MMSPTLFIHGEFSVNLKLPGGYSGGTSTNFVLLDTTGSGQKSKAHSEIDFTFYGNTTADVPLLSTNVYAGGMQNLAQVRDGPMWDGLYVRTCLGSSANVL